MVLLAGCSNEPNSVEYASPYLVSGEHAVYVVNHGWHTGLVVPANSVTSQTPLLKQRFKDADYIEFGWGDQGFYQTKEITTSITLRAILWPTNSVVHAVAVPEDVASYFDQSETKLLCLTNDELTSLTKFIVSSFAQDEQQKVIVQKKGIYGDSQFYQGTGRYHAMNTCNKWTAKGLKSIGIKLSPTFKLTASSVMNALSYYSVEINTEKPLNSCR